MTTAVPFPDTLPPGYEWFDDEPMFDPERHLELTQPTETITLADLGYSDDEIATKATRFAVSSPFRILSDEGAAVMVDICRRLRPFARAASDRIENMVRGTCYRSRFMRDVCLSPDVTNHMSEIYSAEIAPHTMPVHLGHVNYAPSDLSRAVDKWHHDTLPLDYVMMVSDPASFEGGNFEWFRGTKHEAAELGAAGKTPPPERVAFPVWPGPGWAVALHGNMVVHRGGPLDAPGERITMVNGYVATDRALDDQSRHKELLSVDDRNHLYTEWAKHAAWRSAGRLNRLVDELEFTPDRDHVLSELSAAIADVTQAIADMGSDATPGTDHYEK